jgi:CRISPR-associated protein Cas5d
MGYGIRLKVWGDFAAFHRPEMKVERVSYEVMTPSAARGILEAIHWKPEMRWVVDRIHVLKPIRFTQVRRNEIDSRVPVKGATGAEKAMRVGRGQLGIAVEEHRQQRAALVLRDVAYGIEAHVEIVSPPPSGSPEAKAPEAKHLEMFRRRAANGQFFHHPYLGTREFPAFFELVDSFPPCPPDLAGNRDLGLLLHDVVYIPDPDGRVVESHAGRRLAAEPRFFRALLRSGVLEVPRLDPAGGAR